LKKSTKLRTQKPNKAQSTKTKDDEARVLRFDDCALFGFCALEVVF
jgi:hypothetical protein